MCEKYSFRDDIFARIDDTIAYLKKASKRNAHDDQLESEWLEMKHQEYLRQVEYDRAYDPFGWGLRQD